MCYSDISQTFSTVTKNLHYTYPTEADLGAMKVKLAVQVLSRSVGIGLRESGDEDVSGAAELCDMMNGFFDCTNVRSLTEHTRKKNPFIMPYSSPNDYIV
jgi:hypothetical protein